MSKVSSGQAPSTLIPKYIGSDFDKVVTVADNIEDVKQIADAIDAGMLEYTDEIVIVADNIGAVVTVADDITSVVTVATNVADVVTVAQNITDVIAVEDNIADVVAVSGVNQQVSQIAPHIDEVVIVAEHIGEVDTVSDNIEYVIDVAEGLNGMPSTVFSGPNPPTVTPIPEGATWFCTENGRTYIWYQDVDSSQWVESTPQNGFPTEVSGISDTIRDGVVTTAPTENAVFDALVGKQPLDALLTALAALATAPDKMAYFTGVDTVALATLSAFARTLLDDADAATARGTLGAAPAVHTHTADDVGALPIDGSAPMTGTINILGGNGVTGIFGSTPVIGFAAMHGAATAFKTEHISNVNGFTPSWTGEYQHLIGSGWNGTYSWGIQNLGTATPGAFVISHVNSQGGQQVNWKFDPSTGEIIMPNSAPTSENGVITKAYSDRIVAAVRGEFVAAITALRDEIALLREHNDRALYGEFGPVAEYVPPTPAEVSNSMRSTCMQKAIQKVQHYEMLNNATMVAEWKAYYAQVYAGSINSVEPVDL